MKLSKCHLYDLNGNKTCDELIDYKEIFWILAESAPVAIVIVRGEKIIYVNPAFESNFGFTKDEALCMRFWEVVHPDMQGIERERGLARQRGETVSDRYELKIITKDDQARWIDLSAILIKVGGQRVTLAMAYDITEGKLAHNSLRIREQELKDKTHELEEMNSALRVLFNKREGDRIELEEKFQFNVKQLIEPYIYDLRKTPLSHRQASLIATIKTNRFPIRAM